MSPRRRTVLGALATLGAAFSGPEVGASPSDMPAAAGDWPTQAPLGRPRAFSFEALQRRASALASSPYVAPAGPPAELVRAVDYDAFGRIAYRPTATLWGDAGGDRGVRLFPQGRPAPVPVAIHVVSGGQSREVI
jgi:glucans biosynthesis protein